jgi:transcriptional regulator with XRE-family HTH domain
VSSRLRDSLAERIRALIPDGEGETFARRAKIRPETLSRLIQGKAKNPTLKTLDGIADALGIPISDLLWDESADESRVAEAAAPPYGVPYIRAGFERKILVELYFGRYSPGDVLVIDTNRTQPKPGNLVWASVAGEPAELFRFSIEGGAPCLSKDNPLIPKIKDREWQILGIVEDLIHREKSEL